MDTTLDEQHQISEGHEDAEAIWDEKASQYNVSQKKQGMKDSHKIAEMLYKKKRLTAGNVLDVGGGAGLYAIPFAKYAKNVTVADISSNMLFFSKENAADADVRNLEYVKLDWDQANLENLGWNNHFDLVFSSMCPAIRNGESIEKMIASSKNWCCINRYIKMTDSAAERIENLLKCSVPYSTHNNRNRVMEIFNDLWKKGYDPEIDYFEETEEKSYSLDEAAMYYGRRYEKMAESGHADLKEILADLSVNNCVKVTKYKKLALISWQV